MNLRDTISLAFRREGSSISLMVAKYTSGEGKPRLQYPWCLWLKGGIAKVPNSLLQGTGMGGSSREDAALAKTPGKSVIKGEIHRVWEGSPSSGSTEILATCGDSQR